VIWRHATEQQVLTAIEPIKCATSEAGQKMLCNTTGLLPVLPTLFDTPRNSGTYYQKFGEALQKGKPMPALPLWGALERKLGAALAAVWEALIHGESRPVEEMLEEHLTLIAKQLTQTMRLVGE
jgi:ABC-type glycerol-3-phosphate transport system substrate-binding protein